MQILHIAPKHLGFSLNPCGCPFPPSWSSFVPSLLIASYSNSFCSPMFILCLACKPSIATQYTQEKLESPCLGIQGPVKFDPGLPFSSCVCFPWYESPSSPGAVMMVQQSNPTAFFTSVQDNLSSHFLTQLTCNVFPMCLCSSNDFPKFKI